MGLLKIIILQLITSYWYYSFFSSTDVNLPFSRVLRRVGKKVEGLFSKVGGTEFASCELQLHIREFLIIELVRMVRIIMKTSTFLAHLCTPCD